MTGELVRTTSERLDGLVRRPKRPADASRYPAGGTYNYFHTIFNINGRIQDSHEGDYQTNMLGRSRASW